MSAKYLLPCSCGEKMAVETAQAGQTVRCSCGATLDVPTLQGLRRLQQVQPDEPKKTPSFAGAAIGIALLGFVILAAGATITYRTYATRPSLIEVDYMTPWETWLMWQNLRTGVQMPEFAETSYFHAKKVHRWNMAFGITVLVLGAVTLASAGVLAYATSSSRKRKLPSRSP